MAEKRPKQPEIVKNRTFLIISQRIAKEINFYTSNQKNINRRKENKQKRKCSKQQMAAPQNYSWLKSRISEKVDLQNGYTPRKKRYKAQIFLTTFLRKPTEHFSIFYMYVEKIDFKGGPRWPKKIKVGTFFRKLNNFFLRPVTGIIFQLKDSFSDLLTGHSHPQEITGNIRNFGYLQEIAFSDHEY